MELGRGLPSSSRGSPFCTTVGRPYWGELSVLPTGSGKGRAWRHMARTGRTGGRESSGAAQLARWLPVVALYFLFLSVPWLDEQG